MKRLNEIVRKSYIAYLDFILTEFIERASKIDEEIGTNISKDYPNLLAHTKKFLELPQIQKYRKTDKFKANHQDLQEIISKL